MIVIVFIIIGNKVMNIKQNSSIDIFILLYISIFFNTILNYLLCNIFLYKNNRNISNIDCNIYINHFIVLYRYKTFFI